MLMKVSVVLFSLEKGSEPQYGIAIKTNREVREKLTIVNAAGELVPLESIVEYQLQPENGAFYLEEEET